MITSFMTINMDTLSLTNILYVLVTSTILGIILSLVFVYTRKKTVYDHAFSFTLLLLPLVISIIIMLVSNNLARAFSLAGVFALVRFRTAIADSRSIRTTAQANRITYYTTISGAKAAVAGIKAIDQLEVYDLQGLHASL